MEESKQKGLIPYDMYAHAMRALNCSDLPHCRFSMRYFPSLLRATLLVSQPAGGIVCIAGAVVFSCLMRMQWSLFLGAVQPSNPLDDIRVFDCKHHIRGLLT